MVPSFNGQLMKRSIFSNDLYLGPVSGVVINVVGRSPGQANNHGCVESIDCIERGVLTLASRIVYKRIVSI